MNSLVGVLIPFSREDVAAICDVEQMFHSFHVAPKHQDFLRFLWFKENDVTKPIIEYKMTAHLFGNGASPVVAACGLRRTVEDGEEFDLILWLTPMNQSLFELFFHLKIRLQLTFYVDNSKA